MCCVGMQSCKLKAGGFSLTVVTTATDSVRTPQNLWHGCFWEKITKEEHKRRVDSGRCRWWDKTPLGGTVELRVLPCC